ncbi:hypothetical protein PR048_030559 [Dryococelus australis]|uniref:Peptidase aspartic putative domain-containing protein n=1 Tax=Dryococelus australis TaxID=614101 RepID=A0ABQ9G9S4_9NEOP|nr:hypothetical protein PR048_030559 [Dryococelus australis]
MKHKCYNILVKNLRENYSCNIEVLDQPVICGNIIRIITSSPHVRELKMKNIRLTDVGEDEPLIELLLGANFAGVLYSGNTINLSPGLLAVHTYLGWVLMGRIDGELNDSSWSMLSTLLTHMLSIADL